MEVMFRRKTGFPFSGGNDFGGNGKTEIWRNCSVVMRYSGNCSAVNGFYFLGRNYFDGNGKTRTWRGLFSGSAI